jgi:hypothetical protein
MGTSTPCRRALAKRGPCNTGTQPCSMTQGHSLSFPILHRSWGKAAARPVMPNTPAPPASIDAFAAEPLVFADLACLLATLHAVSANAAMAFACPAAAR